MTDILILGQMKDMQTGVYLMNAFHSVVSKVSGVDIRAMYEELGGERTQEYIFEELDDINMKHPDIILVLKGLELSLGTLEKIRKKFPKAVFCNWFFDKYLLEKPIWKNKQMFPMIKFYDFFFCSLKGVADKLREVGFDNTYFLPEACSAQYNAPVYLNNYQKRKYSEDISFVGSIGFLLQHKNRLNILKRIISNGFNIKIYGSIIGEEHNIERDIRNHHTRISVINEDHSKVCQCSLINLGIDQDPTIDLGHSARLYRVMCAGGLYLSTDTKGLSKFFVLNKGDKMPDGSEDMVVYHNEEKLVDLLDFLLEHDDIRKSIALNGQKKVMKYHTFEHRVADLLEMVSKKKQKKYDYRKLEDE